MTFALTERAEAQYHELPEKIKRLAAKQFALLSHRLMHPSLRAKKYDESNDVWQARINREYRFYFMIITDTYYILSVRKHPK